MARTDGETNTEQTRHIPGTAPGVIAMLGKTREGGPEHKCDECGKPITHPSQYWWCGAGWLKPQKGVRHPDGIAYWHDDCLK